MEVLATLSGSISLPLAAAVLLLLGGAAAIIPQMLGREGASDVKRRLHAGGEQAATGETAKKKSTNEVSERAARTAQDFYARTDPENVARLRQKLIQAGYMEPSAVGLYFVVRVAASVGFAIFAFAAAMLYGSSESSNRWMFVVLAGAGGYFLPGLVLSRHVATRMIEYRNGFPDFMDLMIVCSDAGMSMEASIERVSRELVVTYPALAQNLRLVSIELRAGRGLDDALRSLGERLSLDEVRSFATLLQQSRELGTSLSGALRVFSDEMRHKRMSVAEEKAHALPAKMSVPVTVCILPVVIMVAITPIIVKMSAGD